MENQNRELTAVPDYQLTHANSMLDLAKNLADFVKERNLSQNIQGRQYVNIEGWQFCGGMMGILPITTHTENLSTADEIMFSSHCDLINIHTGAKVGYGHAICSNKEKGKKHFEAFAVNSMAQTRAIGKAYRNMLGWLMKAAGYEATPSEELDTIKEQENEIKAAVMEYLQSENREQAKAVWDKYPQYHKHTYFLKAAKALSALYPEPLASDDQVKLLTSLLNSHHIPANFVKNVQGMLADGLKVSVASKIIEELQKYIADGIEYEKNTPATEEQIEIMEMLLENAAFSDEEEAKGKEAVAKGMSIHKANLFISKLEKKLQDSTKQQQEQLERRKG